MSRSEAKAHKLLLIMPATAGILGVLALEEPSFEVRRQFLENLTL